MLRNAKSNDAKDQETKAGKTSKNATSGTVKQDAKNNQGLNKHDDAETAVTSVQGSGRNATKQNETLKTAAAGKSKMDNDSERTTGKGKLQSRSNNTGSQSSAGRSH